MRIFRETLTVIAALLVLALIALAVAPGFMDWNSQRGRVTALLSERLGVPVSISGDLRLSLLPVPEIDAEGVSIGAGDTPAISADRLTASLSLTALASGAIRITAARADKVRIALDEVAEAMAKPVPAAARVQGSGLDRLDIRSATLVAGNSIIAEKVDILIEAPDLSGPFRLDILNPGQSRDIRLQIGRLDQGRARMKGTIEDKLLGMRASLDGLFALPDGSGRAVYDGQVLFNGNPIIGGQDGPQMPLEGSARLIIGAQQAIADPVNIALGSGENAVQFAGQLHADFSKPRPAITSDFSAKRLDASALLQHAESRSAPTGLFSSALTFIEALQLPFDAVLAFNIAAVQVPGGTISDVAMKIEAGSAGLRLNALSAKGPGGSSLAFERAVRAGSRAIDGRLDFATQDPATFMLWLRGGEAAQGLPSSIRLSSGVISDARGFDLPGIFIASDAGALSGSGRLELPSGAVASPRAALDLKAQRFDARVLAALDPLRGQGGMELSSTLDIAALVLDGVVVGGLTVALERDGARATLRRFRLTGPAGEELTLSGSATGDITQLTAKLDAERLEAIARLIAAVLPGAASDGFITRAAALSPALAVANLRIERRTGGDALWEIIADGKLGGSTLKFRSQSTLRGADLIVSLDGDIANEDSVRLMRQLSGAPLTSGQTLPGSLKLKAEGNPRRLISGTLAGSLAGLDIEADGAFNPFRQGRQIEGRVKLTSGDLSVMHRALGGGAPALAPATPARIDGRYFTEGAKITLTGLASEFGQERVTGEISFDFARGGQVAGQLKMGTLQLSTLVAPAAATRSFENFSATREALPAALAPIATGDLWIEARRLVVTPDLALDNPQFILRFAPGAFSIEGLEAKRGDARYSATLTLSRKAAMLDAAGRLAISGETLPGMAGRISAELPFTASGESPFALVSSLGGAGRLTASGITLPEADAGALFRIASRPIDQLLPIEENRIGSLIDQELKRSALPLPDLALPITLLNGQLRLGGTSIDSRGAPAPGIALTPLLLLDLPRAQLDAKIAMRLAAAPPGWRGAPPEIALGWQGRLGDPNPRGGIRRQITVSPLVNGLLAIQLQRDLERAEAFEADVKERAALLRRQKADQFQERRRIELEAFEKIEADRRAKEELEAVLKRQAEEARAAAAPPQPVAPQPAAPLTTQSLPPLNLAPVRPLDLRPPARAP